MSLLKHAKRPHVKGSPTFSNASFRSHVRYIIDVMNATFTSSCSTLGPQAHENTDPTFIFIPIALFLFLPLRECLLVSASMHWEVEDAAQRYFAVLPDFQSLNMDHYGLGGLYGGQRLRPIRKRAARKTRRATRKSRAKAGDGVVNLSSNR